MTVGDILLDFLACILDSSRQRGLIKDFNNIVGGCTLLLTRLKPAVSEKWLLVLAGAVWTTIGMMLCRLSFMWLELVPWRVIVSHGLVGLALAYIISRFGFSYVAQKNINRICINSGKRCIFSFQAWRSYLLVVVMITLGIILRNSPIPKHYLSILYTAIGGALLISSFRYYFSLWHVLKKGEWGCWNLQCTTLLKLLQNYHKQIIHPVCL